MLKECKFIVLSHYDFTDKEGKTVKGSKIVVTYNERKLDLSTKDDTIFKLPLLSTYTCDLYVNENLKIDVTNIRK